MGVVQNSSVWFRRQPTSLSHMKRKTCCALGGAASISILTSCAPVYNEVLLEFFSLPTLIIEANARSAVISCYVMYLSCLCNCALFPLADFDDIAIVT